MGVLPVPAVTSSVPWFTTAALTVSPLSVSDVWLMRLPGPLTVTVPLKVAARRRRGGSRSLLTPRVAVPPRSTVPVPVRVVALPRRVVPLLIESVWPAATLIVPAVSSKVKLVLVRVRGWLTAIVPWLVTCAVRVRRPPVPTEELIVPVLTRVPAVTVSAAVSGFAPLIWVRSMVPALVKPWATVSVGQAGVVVRLHAERFRPRRVAEGCCLTWQLGRCARHHQQRPLVDQGRVDCVAAERQRGLVDELAGAIDGDRTAEGQRRAGGEEGQVTIDAKGRGPSQVDGAGAGEDRGRLPPGEWCRC